MDGHPSILARLCPRAAVLLALVSLGCAPAFALPLRLISTAQLETWGLVLADDTAHSGWVLDEAAILKLGPSTSLIATAKYNSPGSALPLAGGGLGLSLVLAPGLYADLSYSGRWQLEAGVYSNDVESSINYENAFLFAGFRERLEFSGSALALYNSVFGKWSLSRQLALWASYTLVYEAGVGLDQSLWSYAELSPLPSFSLVLGATAASFHFSRPIDGRARGIANSAIASLAIRPSERLGFKYQLEDFFGDRDWNKTSHTLVVDLALP